MAKYVQIFLTVFIVFLLKENVFAVDEIQECFNYLNTQNYEQAISEGQKAVKLYPVNHLVYVCLGKAYLSKEEFNLAIDNLKQAEKYAISYSDLMYIYNWLGIAYDNKGAVEHALSYYNKSLSLARNLKERDMEAVTINNIAEIFHNKGDFEKALSFYKEYLIVISSERDKAFAYNNIALIYAAKGDFKTAIEYLKKSLDMYEKNNDYHAYAQVELNMGNTYRKLKDFDIAQKYLFDGLEKIQQLGDKEWEGTAYKYIGWLHLDQGNKELSKEYFNKALEIFKSIGAQKDIADVSMALSIINAK